MINFCTSDAMSHIQITVMKCETEDAEFHHVMQMRGWAGAALLS